MKKRILALLPVLLLVFSACAPKTTAVRVETVHEPEEMPTEQSAVQSTPAPQTETVGSVEEFTQYLDKPVGEVLRAYGTDYVRSGFTGSIVLYYEAEQVGFFLGSAQEVTEDAPVSDVMIESDLTIADGVTTQMTFPALQSALAGTVSVAAPTYIEGEGFFSTSFDRNGYAFTYMWYTGADESVDYNNVASNAVLICKSTAPQESAAPQPSAAQPFDASLSHSERIEQIRAWYGALQQQGAQLTAVHLGDAATVYWLNGVQSVAEYSMDDVEKISPREIITHYYYHNGEPYFVYITGLRSEGDEIRLYFWNGELIRWIEGKGGTVHDSANADWQTKYAAAQNAYRQAVNSDIVAKAVQ